MDKINFLNMTISNEVGWFEFENVNMDERIFAAIIKTIEDTFVSQFGKEGAKAHMKRDDDGKIKISQVKVPNIIKSLVQHPSQEIQFNLTGITPNKDVVSEVVKKPLDINKVVKLIPHYHNAKTNQEPQQKNTTKR